MVRLIIAIVVCLSSVPVTAALIKDVGTSGAFFNPSLGQTISFNFVLSESARTCVTVLDRDGVPARSLLSCEVLPAGLNMLSWDGRGEDGLIVPDEAWSLLITAEGGDRRETYLPAATTQHAAMEAVKVQVFDRASGSLRYELVRPSRVHIQAGTRSIGGEPTDGAVLKTIVNRAPRAGGSIIERWDGYDESGNIYVPDQPRFGVAIAATPLPENAVITVGNRNADFVSSALGREGISVLPHSHVGSHHAGLTVLQDLSPGMLLSLSRATWDAQEKLWTLDDDELRLKVDLEEPLAEHFLERRGEIHVFVDGTRFSRIRASENGARLAVDLSEVPPGEHILAVNWVSPAGPVAARALRFRIIRFNASGRGEER